MKKEITAEEFKSAGADVLQVRFMHQSEAITFEDGGLQVQSDRLYDRSKMIEIADALDDKQDVGSPGIIDAIAIDGIY